ncbi:hypothetical protein AB0N61_00390 [Microbacterium sp. NPDC089320]|uniref:hypothetical protein n=1 Tax=Microbacterium sp. NPDC089320 TaxID=3155182 RepID=UPI00342B9341
MRILASELQAEALDVGFSDTGVGELQSGGLEWAVTTGDACLAARLRELYPGRVAAIDIVVANSKAIHQRLVLRGPNGEWSCVPSAELTFRLADDPNLGIFVLKSNSWGLAHFLAAEDIEGQIDAVGGPALLRLKLVPVSFIAKNGPRKGKTVSYTSTEIEVLGAA